MKILFKVPILLTCILIIWMCSHYFFPLSSTVSATYSAESSHFSSFHITNDGVTDDRFSELDRQMTQFLSKENLMGGASVSVSHQGQLIYSKGYGWADREKGIAVEPCQLFRVASVSKLLTGVGVMKLVEQGVLSLDDKVFGPEGILNDSVYLNYLDKRVEKITVFQLLNHSGGWTTRWGDPMFMSQVIAAKQQIPLPINMEDIIVYMLSKRLHFEPGTSSSYSNFGFAILGEVISKVAGMPYEKFIQSQILYPLGIFDMRLGRSYKEERLDLEVKYYESDTLYLVDDFCGRDEKVRRSYGGTDIHTLGAAGGWVASSTDLMKLLLALDGFPQVPDILSETSLKTMADNHNNQFSPLGWRKTDENGWYRTGTLAGSSALLVRRIDGVNYVVVLNCANHKGPSLANEIHKVMEKSLRTIGSWPNRDLFENDQAWANYKLRVPDYIN
ncbi:MAG: beta-lactamase family protein [Breznakibacter sp.]|nr:beta-lactamase family protein [Breznakibacter sp.]